MVQYLHFRILAIGILKTMVFSPCTRGYPTENAGNSAADPLLPKDRELEADLFGTSVPSALSRKDNWLQIHTKK